VRALASRVVFRTLSHSSVESGRIDVGLAGKKTGEGERVVMFAKVHQSNRLKIDHSTPPPVYTPPPPPPPSPETADVRMKQEQLLEWPSSVNSSLQNKRKMPDGNFLETCPPDARCVTYLGSDAENTSTSRTRSLQTL